MSLISRLNSPHDFEEEFVIDNYIEIFHHLRATFLIFMCTGKDVGSPFVGELSYLFVFFKTENVFNNSRNGNRYGDRMKAKGNFFLLKDKCIVRSK